MATEKRQEEMEMKSALEEQISQHRETHQKQVKYCCHDLFNWKLKHHVKSVAHTIQAFYLCLMVYCVLKVLHLKYI